MRDKLTRREDRALLRAMREIVLTQFPNPERKDCPGTPVIEAIATKRISMFDPAHEHVTSCSPCFKELTDIRRSLQRRKVLLWAMGTTGTAIVTAVVLFMYFGSHRENSRLEPRTVQSEPPRESQPAPQPGNPVQTGSSVPTPPAQPKYEMASLDLRNVSAIRTVEPPESNSNVQPIEIPRGLLALTVQLPIGSDVGSYEVEIQKANQTAIRSAKGGATIENGITKLLVNLDTTSIQPGEYDFAWRLADFSWRHHPILIR